MRPSRLLPSMGSVLVLVALQLLSASLPQCHAAAYRPHVGIFPLAVLSPPAYAGTVFYQPTEFTPGLNFPAGLTAPVTLPNTMDDPLACSPMTSSVNRYGSPIAGSILLIKRGSCTFYAKWINAQVFNPALIVVYDSTGLTPPLSSIRQFYDLIYIPGGAGTPSPTVPGISISQNDGTLWATACSTNQSLVVTIPGTGPMVAGDRAVLLDLLQHVNFTVQSPTAIATALYSGSRPWNVAELMRTDVDPCLQPLAGLVCINGRVVFLRWLTLGLVGAIPPSIGNLTALALWNIESSSLTSMGGDGFCGLTSLQAFELTLSPLMTTFNDCMENMTALRRFEVIGAPISVFPPTLAALSSLRWVTMQSTAISYVPPVLFTNPLVYLDLSFNRIIQPYVALTSAPGLQYYTIAHNQFSGAMNATDFDGMPALLQWSVAYNAIGGVLPNFVNTTAMQYMDCSSNAINGSIPTSWASLTAVLQFTCPNNRITNPTIAITHMTALQTIDLSNNYLISDYTDAGFLAPDPLSFVFFHLANPGIVTILVSNNNLSGVITAGKGAVNLPKLQTLRMAYNDISGSLPDDLFPVGVPSLDFSYNNLSGAIPPTAPGVTSKVIKLDGNPLLKSTTLPSWMVFDTGSTLTVTGMNYSCQSIRSTIADLSVTVDASAFNYAHCACNQGMFPSPAPPVCWAIPQREVIVDQDMFPSGAISVFAVPTDNSSLTDAWYGSSRMMPGIDTSWQLQPDANSSAQSLQLILTFDTGVFDTRQDVITISARVGSGSSVSYVEVTAIDGLDPRLVTGQDPAQWPAVYSTTEYQASYGFSLAMMNQSRLSVVMVEVLAPGGLVEFQSRDPDSTHFVMTYEYVDSCPSYPDPVTGGSYYWDAPSSQCLVLDPLYAISPTLPLIIYVITGVNLTLIGLATIILLIYRSDAGIRGRAVGFLLLVLGFLAALAVGGVFYALTPTSDAICHARVWLTCLPLVGVLATLVAKTRRVHSIFTMNKLRVKRFTSLQMTWWIVALMSVQVVLLAVFSALQLSLAQVVVPSSSSTAANHRVQQCSQEDGFVTWMIVEVVLLGLFILGAAVYAFLTRNLPADFNESLHIAISLALLLLLGVIFVPLDLLIVSVPEAALLIQGFGQNVVVFFLTTILYSPKLYYIWGMHQGKKIPTLPGKMTDDSTTQLSHHGGGSATIRPMTGHPDSAGQASALKTQLPITDAKKKGTSVSVSSARPKQSKSVGTPTSEQLRAGVDRFRDSVVSPSPVHQPAESTLVNPSPGESPYRKSSTGVRPPSTSVDPLTAGGAGQFNRSSASPSPVQAREVTWDGSAQRPAGGRVPAPQSGWDVEPSSSAEATQVESFRDHEHADEGEASIPNTVRT